MPGASSKNYQVGDLMIMAKPRALSPGCPKQKHSSLGEALCGKYNQHKNQIFLLTQKTSCYEEIYTS